jgi:hypothetical protein
MLLTCCQLGQGARGRSGYHRKRRPGAKSMIGSLNRNILAPRPAAATVAGSGAGGPTNAPDGNMVEKHPFTIRIERTDDGERTRYCWSIFDASHLRANSPHSYATKREAKIEGEKRARILVANLKGKL